MPANFELWSNAQILVETARSATQTITGVTLANPGVVSYTGADPVNGARVVMVDVLGMNEVADRVFRIANVDAGANTFQLEDETGGIGIDTTLFKAFVSGGFQVLTLGASMQTVRDLNGGGGEYQYADLTTIHVDRQQRVPTVSSPLSYNLGCLFKIGDAAHKLLRDASARKITKAIEVIWASGGRMLFSGTIGASGIPAGSAQQAVTTSVQLEGYGRETYYAT